MPTEGAAGPAARNPPRTEPSPYAWYMLGVLVLVYVFNYVDRQLLTILAPDLKRDLGISDSDFGFLYGTAFGLFYSLFGIPLGRLADGWPRVRLLSIGMALWSVMTAVSGLSRNFGQIAAARVGVGIGEATAAPCAYSLIADSFPPRRRATAIGIYSSGLFIGGGVSLFLGSSISAWWNGAFAPGGAPLDLVGWQAAFIIVGAPGLLMAAWITTLREPPRGRFDAITPALPGGSPWPGFFRELGNVVPPFTLLGAARRGVVALALNLGGAAAIGLAAALLARLSGDTAQWIAVGIGVYAVFSWATALRSEDPQAFEVLFRSRSFVGISLAYGLISFIGYANLAFTPLYALQELGADIAQAGFVIGGAGALGGGLGVVIGGLLADRVARDGAQSRRIPMIVGTASMAFVSHAAMFSADGLDVFYAGVFVSQFFASASLAGASGAVINIVPGRFRGTATAAFLMTTNMLGLALGPYTGGKMSTLLGSLGAGMLSLLALVPVILALLALAWRGMRSADGSARA